MHCQTWKGIPWHTSTTSAEVMETEGRRRSAAPHVVKLLSWREWRAILFGFSYSSSFSIENVECSYRSGRTRSIICSQHISEEFSRQLSDLVNSFYSQRQSAASRTKSIMQRNTYWNKGDPQIGHFRQTNHHATASPGFCESSGDSLSFFVSPRRGKTRKMAITVELPHECGSLISSAATHVY